MKAEIQALRDLLADPSHWTQQLYARDKLGDSTWPKDDDAVCWCLVGGLMKVIGEAYRQSPVEIFLQNRVIATNRGTDLISFNDRATHEEVLAFLDETLEVIK